MLKQDQPRVLLTIKRKNMNQEDSENEDYGLEYDCDKHDAMVPLYPYENEE